MDLLAWLAFGTMGTVIAFAIWSKMRTERKLEEDHNETSPLARETPDPQFQPDADVTNPHDVTDNNTPR